MPTPGSWDFLVCDGAGNTLTFLTRHQGTRLTFTRNGVPECQVSLSHDDDECAVILNALKFGTGGGVPTLKGYRNRALKFNGYLATISEESGTEASTATFTFRGPFGRLLGDSTNAGRFTGASVSFAATDAGQIAKSLIDTANAQGPTGIITTGTIQATKNRDRTYQYVNVGEAVTNLSAVLDGYDFEVAPFVSGALPPLSAPTSLTASPNGPLDYIPYYKVTAVDPNGETTGGLEASPPGPYAGFLVWNAVPGAVGYRVYRSSVSGGESTSPALVGQTTATIFGDTGAPPSAGAVPSVNTTGGTVTGLGLLNVYAQQGSARPRAKFEYGPSTLANCSALHRQTIPPINVVTLTGANGLLSTKTHAGSIALYGRYEYQQQFTDVTDQATLDDKANALLRPNPVKTLDFTPDPRLGPSPYDDYWLGDTVSFYAKRGALVEGPTSLRVNQITVVIDPDTGLESTEIPNPLSPDEERTIRASLQAEVVA